jgi:uncharacterized protein (DUF488 family)
MTRSRLPTIWSVGHSTRSLRDYLDVLEGHGIEAVADVRRFPGSRRMPHFSNASLGNALAARGILYGWIPELGGRRRADPASLHTGWRHAAFRAYADHLQSEEFAVGLQQLLTVAHGARTAMMCAEALWWRCHRRLIADVLTTLGASVRHIRDASAAREHELSPPARLVRGRLSYTPPSGER